MDKKGLGWSTIVIIVILLISVAIIMVWQIGFGSWIKGQGEPLTCKISFIQSKDLSRLKCELVPVEIEADNVEDAKKELLDLVNKMSGDFLLNKKFTENGGIVFENTFCKRRYNIIFKNDLTINNFREYLNKNLSDNLKNRVQVLPNSIEPNKIYTLVLVVVSNSYFDTWWDKGVSGFIKAVAWKGVESDYIGFAFSDVTELDKLKCDNPI